MVDRAEPVKPYEFTIQAVHPSQNKWDRLSRFERPRITRAWAWECRVLKPRWWPAPPPGTVRVTIVRVGRTLLDADGVSVKAILDGLTQAGLIRDDSAPFIELVNGGRDQELTKDQPHTRIRLEPL